MNEWIILLRKLTAKLDAAGIPYMICGSHASGIYGDQRTTHDVDLVVEPTRESLRAFVGSLGEEFYVSASAADDAFRRRGMFNIIESATGLKADLFVRKERPFAIEGFRRRRPGRLGDLDIMLISPEDSILSKLEWARQGESERQVRDAIGVAAVQGEQLDLDYLRRWAVELGVAELLEKVLEQAAREAEGV